MSKLWHFALIAAISIVAGCVSGQDDRKFSLSNTGAPDIHAVSDERLKVIMRKLKSLTVERFASELEIEKQEERYFREVADIAAAVGNSARSIPDLGVGQQLNPVERKVFLGFAGKLVDQADDMKALADSGQSRKLRTAMRSMIGTCNSCHDRFRNMLRAKP